MTWMVWPGASVMTGVSVPTMPICGALSSAITPTPSAAVITGASLVPVMVTVTGWLTVPPWPSETVTV